MCLKFPYLIFRYQRLVPGRENIAAEHLVPQLGYVATSKNETNQTQALNLLTLCLKSKSKVQFYCFISQLYAQNLSLYFL